jgi:hypothetical protein
VTSSCASDAAATGDGVTTSVADSGTSGRLALSVTAVIGDAVSPGPQFAVTLLAGIAGTGLPGDGVSCSAKVTGSAHSAAVFR